MPISNVIPQLRTTDIAESIRFYTEKLGFELEFQYEDFYAGIKVSDGQVIHLKLIDATDPSIDNVRNGGHLHLFFSVDDITSTAEKFRAAGVEFFSEVETKPWGTREFYILDDQGHVLCFAKENSEP
jgi:catechol 2,3-dioxygenase-like lactoylglutathione lyase family enzyme